MNVDPDLNTTVTFPIQIDVEPLSSWACMLSLPPFEKSSPLHR